MRDRRAPAVLAILTLAGAAACSRSAPDADGRGERASSFSLTPEQRQKIQVEPLAPQSFRRSITTTGTVTFDADHSTQVLAPFSGPVSRLLVTVGARVKAGDPLAAVASPDFAADVAAYRKAVAQAANARRIADLDKKLFANDAIARRDMEQAEADAVSAESDREAALQQLQALGVGEQTLADIREGRPVTQKTSVIRSPIDGTVVEKLITPGQLLEAGATPCFTVADLSTVWVMAHVFDADLPFVSAGDPAEVTTGVTGEPFPGKVDYVAAMVDPATRATAVRIVARNHRDILKKDLYVRVSIQSRRESKGLLAPVSAILRDEQNLPFVFVDDGKEGFARRRVELGSRVGDRQEIVSGLEARDRVVVEGGLFMQFAESQ